MTIVTTLSMEGFMKVITAKDAKLRFGELLDTMQREPVLITKNSRPVGIFLSLQDVQGTHLEQLFDWKNEDYQEWESQKILEAFNSLENEPDNVIPMSQVHSTALEKAKRIIASRAK